MMEKFDADRLSPRDMATQFETKFSVGSYLAYQGDRFGERFDANSYVTLSMAMDLFDLGGTPEELAAVAAAVPCRWLVISYTSDWLFPPFQSQQIVDALVADEQAGQLLQRGELLRARRVPAAQRTGQLRRDDRRLPGEPERGASRVEVPPGQRSDCRSDPRAAALPRARGTADQHLPRPAAAGLRFDRRTDPGRGQRAGLGLRHRRTAVAAAATRTTRG